MNIEKQTNELSLDALLILSDCKTYLGLARTDFDSLKSQKLYSVNYYYHLSWFWKYIAAFNAKLVLLKDVYVSAEVMEVRNQGHALQIEFSDYELSAVA